MGKAPKGNFKGHIYSLCLNRKLYLQTIRLQADMKLGKAFSALLPFVVGLHCLGYLEDAEYEVYRAKYSVGLDIEPLSPTQIKKRETKENRNRQLNRHFGEVLSQWGTLKQKSREYHLKEAGKPENKSLKNAKLLLDLEKPNTLEVS